MSQGAWVLVVAVALAAAFGVFRMARDGRFRGTHPLHDASPLSTPLSSEPAAASEQPSEPVPLPLDGLGQAPGERATLLQFSSAFCAPCRATRRVLHEVATVVPGVVHVEIDAEQHLDVVRRLGIVRTPTTLVLDGAGREVSRASGAPRTEEVLAALRQAL